jgi:hypothetical protein
MPKETKVARVPVPVGQFLEDQSAFKELLNEGWKPIFARMTTDEQGEQYALVDLVRMDAKASSK